MPSLAWLLVRCTHLTLPLPLLLVCIRQYNVEEGAWDEVFPSAQSGHMLAWALNLSHLALGAWDWGYAWSGVNCRSSSCWVSTVP